MSSKFDDPHVGGRLEDMAPTGTKIPNDAGVQNIIPSVARPDQIGSNADEGDAGARNLAEAADNSRDIPRVCLSLYFFFSLLPPSISPLGGALTFLQFFSFPFSSSLHNLSKSTKLKFTIFFSITKNPQSTKDQAPVDDILTGTGDTLPAEVGSKRLHFGRRPEASKGHPREDLHGKQKGSHFDHEAGEGGEEEKVEDGVVGGR